MDSYCCLLILRWPCAAWAEIQTLQFQVSVLSWQEWNMIWFYAVADHPPQDLKSIRFFFWSPPLERVFIPVTIIFLGQTCLGILLRSLSSTRHFICVTAARWTFLAWSLVSCGAWKSQKIRSINHSLSQSKSLRSQGNTLSLRLSLTWTCSKLCCYRSRMSWNTWHAELLFLLLPHYHINVSSIHVTDLTSSLECLCFIVYRSRTYVYIMDHDGGSLIRDHDRNGGSCIVQADRDNNGGSFIVLASDNCGGSWSRWQLMVDTDGGSGQWLWTIVASECDGGFWSWWLLWLQQDCLIYNISPQILDHYGQ